MVQCLTQVSHGSSWTVHRSVQQGVRFLRSRFPPSGPARKDLSEAGRRLQDMFDKMPRTPDEVI